MLERWKKTLDPIFSADKFKLMTQTANLNPLVTTIPLKITNSPNYTPILSLLTPDFNLLPLSDLLNRIQDCALNFLTYETLKAKVTPTLTLIKHQYNNTTKSENL